MGYRVHGGGFGGTILVIVPKEAMERYRERVSSIFGNTTVQSLRVRQLGCVNIERLTNPQMTIAPM